ncbi:MAG TPA: 2-oxoacid:acceptor oxidoreductase subunit alpha [Phycisphaerae bacterium]|nr:2-oxoacid:acceptor oxidoreductase subunit alpha [Phycisphaerae bacterium]
MDINLRIAGEAGQGVQTTGNLLIGALARAGLHVLGSQSYMSRIRGGLNWFDIRVGDRELFAPARLADVLVALTAPALEILGPEVTEGGLVLFDGPGMGKATGIEFTKAAKEVAGSKVMANTVAAGAVFRACGYDVDGLCEYLGEQFGKKGSDVVDANVRCAHRGAELAEGLAGKVAAPSPSGASGWLVSGAEAVGLGAATAGVRFLTAYPMTPGTATLTHVASIADRYGIIVEQAEDEIAAINMVIGAAYAGAPAMTVTSGGGFALMVEGLSLAGMTESPAVILIAQRPGPATGLPTRTGQEDLLFALHAGHGTFPRAVFAPGTQRQCYDITRRAVETSHKAQTPVIILSDQFLQDLQKNIPPLDEAPRPVDRHVLTDPPEDYRRYEVTDSGVSPRALPGGPALVVVDSDEHDQDGHLTEDLEIRVIQQDKRMRKGDLLAAEALPPEWYGPEKARTLLVAWGSTYGPCREAVDLLNADGPRAAMLHFSQVWPINAGAARPLLERAERILCVEGNCTGQFASLLRTAGLLGECELVRRYDGLPFTADRIAEEVAS